LFRADTSSRIEVLCGKYIDVMAGHSRLKDGYRFPFAYVPASTFFFMPTLKTWSGRDWHCRVQCGVTIDARNGTSDPDNSCPAKKPKLTYDLHGAGSPSFMAVYLNRRGFSKRNH
jgi:hypothetical protein